MPAQGGDVLIWQADGPQKGFRLPAENDRLFLVSLSKSSVEAYELPPNLARQIWNSIPENDTFPDFRSLIQKWNLSKKE
jgi:hypothetical protein